MAGRTTEAEEAAVMMIATTVTTVQVQALPNLLARTPSVFASPEARMILRQQLRSHPHPVQEYLQSSEGS